MKVNICAFSPTSRYISKCYELLFIRMCDLLNTLEKYVAGTVEQILNNSIFSTLIGERGLSEDELLEIKNNFYIQDYYYLVYGYKVVNNILLDRRDFIKSPGFSLDKKSLENALREIIGCSDSTEETSDEKIRNLVNSSTIKTINQQLIRENICLSENLVHEKVAEYISFKIQTAFHSDTEAIVIGYACIFVYEKIYYHIQESVPSFKNLTSNRELYAWINTFWNSEVVKYGKLYRKYLNSLDKEIDETRLQKLKELFKKACEYERDFFQSLIAN